MHAADIHKQHLQTHARFKNDFHANRRVIQIIVEGRETLRRIKTQDVMVTHCPLGQQYTPYSWQSQSLAAVWEKLIMLEKVTVNQQ